MRPSAETLVAALRSPQQMFDRSWHEWNALLRLARRMALTSRLAGVLLQAEHIEHLPAKATEQLRAAMILAEHQRQTVLWEVDRVHQVLQGQEVQVVWLKGAAYVLADLPIAHGRLLSDLDLLVPRECLDHVERALRDDGWEPLSQDEYDEGYYRRWMHELPPLRHRDRGTVLDVHHTILPLTGKLHPDPERLLQAARAVPGECGFVLSPEDMVLHAAAHAFQDGDLSTGIRDLIDLDSLLRHFGSQEFGFWQKLVPRACELQLERPLYYALRFTARSLATSIPAEVVCAAQQGRPTWPVRCCMDGLVARALWPGRAVGNSWSGACALLLLYIRSHWLRMPPWLLAKHLTRKALQRRLDRQKAQRTVLEKKP